MWKTIKFQPQLYIAFTIFKRNQLIIKLINDIESAVFENAVQLGDNNSKTLGFLPFVAFEKYAKENQLFGAFDSATNELCGYLLYRISYNKVTIVHCCIDDKHRNKGLAKTLVDYLKKNTKQYFGIRLSCRNDYGINGLWESLSFVPVKERIGRSKKGLPLTEWWYSHNQTDLFSFVSDYELKNKIIAVIDMNIFLDIKDERNKESLSLNSDWITSEAILYVTREIYVEIHRGKTEAIKKSSRNLLSHFEKLPCKDEIEYLKILNELKAKFPEKCHFDNDKSDLSHLSYSIEAGAEYFITRDEKLLNNRDFFKSYALTIYRPSEFISRLDENIQTTKYKPQELIGTTINSQRITADNIEDFVTLFLAGPEKKNRLQAIIRNALSQPIKFELLTVIRKNEILAFFILNRTESRKLTIPIFRFQKNSLKNTLSKYLIYKAILIATTENRLLINITEKYIDDDFIRILEESRLVEIKGAWSKLNIGGISTKFEVTNQIEKFSEIGDSVIPNIIKEINAKTHSTDSELIKSYNIERHLWPIKISDLEIPTYIVPIKPQWAEFLFNDKSQEKLPIFEPNYDLLLNSENVYYRSSNPKILEAPARILWYSSANKLTGGGGKIIAASYLDGVFVDTPKRLYKQFEQLGAYTWQQVSATAKGKNKLMAFVFSDTELFKQPISLYKTRTIYKEKENKNFMIVTPVKIKISTYLALYKLGMKL